MTSKNNGKNNGSAIRNCPGLLIQAAAFDANTLTMYGSDLTSGLLLRLDPFGTQDRIIGSIGLSQVRGLAYDTYSNALYGADTDTDQLITIDTSSGAGTAVGPFGAGFGQIEGLAFDTNTQTLYGVQNDGGTDGRLVRIDATTGTATQIGITFADLGPTGLAYVPGLPDGFVGEPYGARIPIAGGCPPYIVSSESGLPAGLTINSTGSVNGTPAESGEFTINFTLGDSNLSTLPFNTSTPFRIRPSNDSCSNSVSASDGDLLFNTLGATTDGPDEPITCDSSGYTQVGSDIWFCHTAECTGDLTVSLCESNYDTKLAVYAGCTCPVASPPLACNDDSCGGSGLASEVTIPVLAGQDYLIRIGGYAGVTGRGRLSIHCVECVSDGECNDGNLCTQNTCVQDRCRTNYLTCDDSNPCTTDSCTPAIGCSNSPVACDDESACTTESCNPANGACEITPISCADADACNGVETCDPESGCVAGTPLNCDDSDPCTVDECDTTNGCVFSAGIDCNSNGALDECDRVGDADGDDDLTLSDLPSLLQCLTESGPAQPYVNPCCRLFDFDQDGRVDAADYAAFQLDFGIAGPN